MSFKIGMILSKDCNKEILKKVKDEFRQSANNFHNPCLNGYFIYLKKIKNPYIDKQIMADENFFEVSEYHDSVSSIGAWRYYDINTILEECKRIIHGFRVTDSYISEIEQGRRAYEEDAKRWIEIIKFIKSDCKIKKVGIFSYMMNTSADKMKFKEMERIECYLEELSLEYILKIEMNKIVFFL